MPRSHSSCHRWASRVESNPYDNRILDHRVVRDNTQTLHTRVVVRFFLYSWYFRMSLRMPKPIPLKSNGSRERNDVSQLDGNFEHKLRTKTPNIDVQTELSVQKLRWLSAVKLRGSLCSFGDRVEVTDIDVQLAALLDRLASPLFSSHSTGQDMTTQIENGDINLHFSRNDLTSITF